MSLKELTIEQHRNAERQKFAEVLTSGVIPKISYLRYLVNQHACYLALENLSSFSLPNEKLKRNAHIKKDIDELTQQLDIVNPLSEMLTNSTKEYIDYVKNLQTEDDFMAHVYVRYLGDLRGGQMISKKIPGAGHYYDFQDPTELANDIYRKLNDDMAEEAKKVFDFATCLFIEMYDIMISKKEI